MARTISDRLSAAAESSFIGRREELTLLSDAIEAHHLPFVVAFIHGPGGIGKSSLLQAALSPVRPEVCSLALDCRGIEPTAKGFLSALGDALGTRDGEPELHSVAAQLRERSRRTVLALDTYETFGLMDTWLRQEFIPALPETVLTIIAGREAPNSAWLTTPGWHGLFREMELRELPDDDAGLLLASRGLAEAQIGRISRFARGHPLALELAAAAFRAQPGLEIAEGPPPKVLQQLTDAFLAGLPPKTTEAVEAGATVRRLTEPILRALLAINNVRKTFDALRGLPFADAITEGLVLHDVVRETVANNLAQRDPERHRVYRTRAWRFFTKESHIAAGNLWQSTADLLYLIENPVVREAFFPKGASGFSVEPATDSDSKQIRDIAASTDDEESARLIVRWWKRHPETFSVAKTQDGKVAAFYLIFEPASVNQDLLADDPLTVAWSHHLRENPVAEEERVLFLRRWLARGTGEAPSPGQAACWLDIKRTYMEMRPHLRKLYTTVIDLPTYAPIVLPLGFAPLEEASVPLGGTTYHTTVLDFGESSVDGWLSRLIGAELGVEAGEEEEAELPEGTVTILFADIADSTSLTEQLGDAAFRARARELDASLQAVISETGGRAVEGKLLGDGVMAVFTSARQAIECALRCKAAAQRTKLGLHLGVHAGDVIREGDNVFGGGPSISQLASPPPLFPERCWSLIR